jgi:hypothetical protein
MKNYLLLLALTLCLFGGTAKAQIHIEKTHYTFEPLTKTIIPFTAAGEPRVSIEPGLEGKFVVEALGNGDYQIVFPEALPAKAYLITVASGQQQKTCSLLVISHAVRENFSYRSAYFGRRIPLETEIPLLAKLPREQFSIESRIDTEEVKREPYTEVWESKIISATTKRVRFSIIWTYPPSGERIAIFTKEYLPSPMPPSLHCNDVRLTHTIPKAGSVDILVSGIAIGALLPLDSAASHASARPLPLLVMFEEVKVLSLLTLRWDPATMWLKLYPDSTISAFRITTETATILHSTENKSDGTFDVLVRIVGIPAGVRAVRGRLEFTANIAAQHPATDSTSKEGDAYCSIGINIPLGESTKTSVLLPKSLRTSTVRTSGKSVKARGK